MITSNLIISSANPSHRPAIIQMLEAAKLPVADLPPDLSNFFVASNDNQLVGVIGVEIYGDHALLRSLVVDPACRNQNIAQQLVLRVEDLVKKLKLAGIYLLTETARGYFEKKGFAMIQREEVPDALQRSSEFSHVCLSSAIVMKKPFVV